MSGTRHVVVARLRKPHGLKGEFTLFPITDDPETLLAPGREVALLDLGGEPVGEPLVVERSRGYHREWLIKFRGRETRDEVEDLRGLFLAVPAEALRPLEAGEVYLHELAGFAVRLEDGTAVGIVSDVYELPAGLAIEVQGPRREFLLPYRQEFVREVDRGARRLTIAPPEGLLEG